MRTSYGPKCLDLAEYFYPTASKEQLDELAQRFQERVEDFCDPEDPTKPMPTRAPNSGASE